jgi:hypothetical protein
MYQMFSSKTIFPYAIFQIFILSFDDTYFISLLWVYFLLYPIFWKKILIYSFNKISHYIKIPISKI